MDAEAGPDPGAAGTLAPRDRYVALRLGSGRLLLPQDQVRALEPWLDAEPAAPGEGPAAWLAVGGIRWPVYAPGPELELVPAAPAGGPVCVLLEDGSHRLALACADVENVDPRALRIRPLPPSMGTPGGAVSALGILGEDIVPVSDAAGLTRRLAGGPARRPDAESGEDGRDGC